MFGGKSCNSSVAGRLSGLALGGEEEEEEDGAGLFAGLTGNSRISNIFRLHSVSIGDQQRSTDTHTLSFHPSLCWKRGRVTGSERCSSLQSRLSTILIKMSSNGE